VVRLYNLEPLERLAHLSKVHINGLVLNIIRNRDGTINFTSLHSADNTQSRAAGSTTSAARNRPSNSPPPPAQINRVQTTASGPAPKTASAATVQASAADFALDSFELINGKVDITDNTGLKPAKLALQQISIGIKDLRTPKQTEPAPFEISAQLGSGGVISLKGAIDLAQSQVASDIAVDRVALPPLQDFGQSILAGQISAGTLGVHAKVQAQFAPNHFNVHLGSVDGSIENFGIRSSREQQEPVKWKLLSLTLSEADLANRRATVKEIRSEGLSLFVRREHDGKLSLASLLASPASPASEMAPESSVGKAGGRAQLRHTPSYKNMRAAAANTRETVSVASNNPWQYTIESAAIEQADIRGEDDAAPQRVLAAIAPFNVHLRNISSDPAKQLTVETDGVINGNGKFKVIGALRRMPLRRTSTS
jgi:hypothetical protein